MNSPRDEQDDLFEMLAQDHLGVSSTTPMPGKELQIEEIQKLDAAIDAAERSGIVVSNTVGNPNGKRVTLAGSAHFSMSQPAAQMPDFVWNSQHEMFMFLYYLNHNKVTSGMYMEGLRAGGNHKIIGTLTLNTPTGEPQEVDLYSPEAQNVFFKYPNIFKSYLLYVESHGSHPTFYNISSYAGIRGAYSEATATKTDEVKGQQHRVNEIIAKYSPGSVVGEATSVRYKVAQIGGSNRIFINDQPFTPQEVQEDFGFLYQHDLDGKEFSLKRDAETIHQRLHSAPSNEVPMSWTGVNHLPQLTEQCVNQGMHVRTVVATSTHRDLERINQQSLDSSTQMYKDFMELGRRLSE